MTSTLSKTKRDTKRNWISSTPKDTLSTLTELRVLISKSSRRKAQLAPLRKIQLGVFQKVLPTTRKAQCCQRISEAHSSFSVLNAGRKSRPTERRVNCSTTFKSQKTMLRSGRTLLRSKERSTKISMRLTSKEERTKLSKLKRKATS